MGPRPVRSGRREISHRQSDRDPLARQLIAVDAVEPPPQAARRLHGPSLHLAAFHGFFWTLPPPGEGGCYPVRKDRYPGHDPTPRADMRQLIKGRTLGVRLGFLLWGATLLYSAGSSLAGLPFPGYPVTGH